MSLFNRILTEGSAAGTTPRAAEASPSPLQKRRGPGRGPGRGVARCYLSRRLVSIAAAFTLGAVSVNAQVPQFLNYQGRVTVGGTNFDGTGQFKFALVNATGSTNYWSNDGLATGQPVVAVALTVTKGLYSVLLGDTSVPGMGAAVPPLIFAKPDVRLRVWFNDGASGFQQLSPDQRVGAVGYALVSANVDPTADVCGQRLLIGTGHALSGLYSTIAGGTMNGATTNYAMVGGGLRNLAIGAGSTIAGGVTNTAIGLEATVSGGEWNWATGAVSTVSGGYGNLAGGFESSVAGGELNGAYGTVSSVGGGYGNIASGFGATIPGGYGNLASGQYSLAAGARAAATNDGAFVWADASSTNATRSTANNQFTARCAGGARFFTTAAATIGVQLAAGGNAWSATSDRNLKEDFKPVDSRAVLAKLVTTPVTEWNLISQDPAIRHIGPMAQDFKAAFGVGEDDRHISTTDADGVAFAAIQGLHEVVKEKDARIAELEKRLGSLEDQVRQLARQIERSPAAP